MNIIILLRLLTKVCFDSIWYSAIYVPTSKQSTQTYSTVASDQGEEGMNGIKLHGSTVMNQNDPNPNLSSTLVFYK